MNELIKETVLNLKKNNMVPFYAEKKEDILPIIKTLIKDGEKIAVGGSATLSSIDAIEFIKNGNYNFIDRYEADITAEERSKRLREGLLSDVFITSTNALSKRGELINVDGFGNRVAAMLYGPQSVIVVAGINKIVDTAEDGFIRIKKIAAPKNCARLSRETYCKFKNECMGLSGDSFTSGCASPQRICSMYTVQGYQLIKDRIKVIICGEELGY